MNRTPLRVDPVPPRVARGGRVWHRPLTAGGRPTMGEVTELIVRARAGDRSAGEALFRAVYEDLRRIAARQVGARPGEGPGRTSLVHEAYLRLARPGALDLNDRQHFFAVAARAMRQIAVDRARERLTTKRGEGARATTLGALDGLPVGTDDLADLIGLDAALEALEVADPRLARLVELRVFVGLELEEAGELLGLSVATLKRDFRKARAFLHARLAGPVGPDEPAG
jgi:RNA polymerase sigma factor (TIGR02999 family)